MDGRGGRQLSRWLASSSAAALLIGASVPAAVACSVNDVGVSTGPVSNAASIDCFNVQNSTVTGSVTNSSGGRISASGSTAPAATGITIDNSTITGAVSNAGVITSASKTGILITNNATVSGGITNSGSISAGQAGINVASDAASFAGGILNSGTISGAIQIGISTFTGGVTNSGTILAASTGVSIGGGLVTSFSGGITNSGTISSGGVHGLFIVNVSTFSGGIVNRGTISATHTAIDIVGGQTFSGGVTNTGTLSAQSFSGIFVTGTTTFLGGITNSGTISGGKGIAIENVSVFAGGITNSGTIVARTGIVISGSVSSFAGGITNSGNITGTGGTAIDVSAASVAISIGQAGGTIAGAIKLSANGDTLTQTGGSIAGSIIGQGNGQLVFNLGALAQTFGPSANITNVGTISVNSGTLMLNGSNNSAATVSLVGGTLAGIGTIAAAVTNSGGILAPGDDPGTFSITGNYLQASPGTLQIAVNPQTASKLAVSGTASLAGTLKLVYAPGVYQHKTYDILHAGTVSGTFTTISSNAGSFVTQSVFFTSSSGAVSVTPNAGTTDVDITTSDGTFDIDPGTDAALPALRNAALAGAQDANAGILDYLAHGQTGAFTQSAQVAFAGNAQSLGALAGGLPERMSQLGGWFRGAGTFATLSGGAPTVKSDSGGFVAGLDRPVAADLSAGVAFGYSHTSLAVHDGETGTIDTPRLMLYGRYDLGAWTLGAAAGYGYDRFHTTRSVSSLAETASSGHDGHEATAAVQASTRLAFGAVEIVPAVGFNYVHLYETGFTETGAALDDLQVAHQNSDSLRPFVGAQASQTFVTSGGARIVPAASVTYSREFMNAPPSSVQIGGGTFAVDGLTPSRDAVTVGAAVAASLTDSLALFADYRATLPTGNLLAQSVSAGLTVRF